MNNWILICNSNYFEIKNALDTLQEITWPQLDGSGVGDIVYMYVTNPYQSILYCCKIEQLNLHRMDSRAISYVSSPLFYKDSQTYMRLKRIQTFSENLLTDDELRDNGLVNLQSSSKLPQKVADYIAQKTGLVEKYNVVLTTVEAQNGCNKYLVLNGGKQINVTYPAGLKEGQSVRIRFDGKIVYIQISISDTVVNTKKKSIEVKNSKIGRGMFGAILGGLLSSATWILVYKLGYIIGIAGLISAALVFKGYELFGKLLDKKGIIISLIILAITIYYSVFLGMTVSVLTRNDYLLSFSNIRTVFVNSQLLLFRDGEYAVSVLLSLFLAYFFSGCASFALIERVIKNKTVSR